jgi:hypothetical protein
MKIRLLAFARAGDAIGSSEMEIEMPDGSRVAAAGRGQQRRQGVGNPLRAARRLRPRLPWKGRSS